MVNERSGTRGGALALVATIGIGVLTAIQARINGALGVALDNGIAAAVISFGSGLAIMIVLAIALPAGRAGVGRLWRGIRDGGIPWWLLIGGAGGATMVAMQGLVAGVIGTALLTVGLVAGQTLSGLVLDRVGYSPSGVTAVTVSRVVGVVLALAAVAVSLGGGAAVSAPLWMLLVPVLVGGLLAWQAATNGRLRQRADSALAATLVNFVVGTLVLLVVAAIQVPQAGLAALPAQPWMYLGGAIGVVFIFISAALAPRVGVLLLSLGSVLGMLLGSLVIDLLWPPAIGVDPVRSGITVAIACAGVAIAAVRFGRRR